MALIGILPVFLVRASFPDVPIDLCDGLHEPHDLFSKSLGLNGLLFLKLSIPPKHHDEFWVYQLWIIKVSSDSTEKQIMLYVKADDCCGKGSVFARV